MSGLQVIAVLCLASGLSVGNGFVTAEACHMCPPGWINFEKSCYLFHFSPMDWADAERHCTTVGGNLPSLHSKEEYEFLRNTVHQLTVQHMMAWLGGYDAAKEGVWLWSDGSHFDFNNWGRGQPNNAHGNENCMHMNLKGMDYINDMPCHTKMAFFCEQHH